MRKDLFTLEIEEFIKNSSEETFKVLIKTFLIPNFTLKKEGEDIIISTLGYKMVVSSRCRGNVANETLDFHEIEFMKISRGEEKTIFLLSPIERKIWEDSDWDIPLDRVSKKKEEEVKSYIKIALSVLEERTSKFLKV